MLTNWKISTIGKMSAFITDEDGMQVASVPSEHARLIAAAPELLELAHAFRSWLEDDSRSPRRRLECLNGCNAVIAKATQP